MTVSVRDLEVLEFVRQHTSQRSPDPSTKVGAALLTLGRHSYYGCNRPPARLYRDVPNAVVERALSALSRAERLELMIHAEEDVLLRAGALTQGATLYVGAAGVCAHCARLVCETGVERVVSYGVAHETVGPADATLVQQWERWGCARALVTMRSAGIIVELLRNP